MAQLQFSEWLLIGVVFLYGLNLGPMMFESFTSDRLWASHPPESFAMFLGQYGHKTAQYWRVVSPLALVSFLLSLVFNWHLANVRWWLSFAFIMYGAIQLWTMVYFVPEQETLIAGAGSLPPNALKSRVDRWILLNYFRNVAGVFAFVLLMRAVLGSRIP